MQRYKDVSQSPGKKAVHCSLHNCIGSNFKVFCFLCHSVSSLVSSFDSSPLLSYPFLSSLTYYQHLLSIFMFDTMYFISLYVLSFFAFAFAFAFTFTFTFTLSLPLIRSIIHSFIIKYLVCSLLSYLVSRNSAVLDPRSG